MDSDVKLNFFFYILTVFHVLPCTLRKTLGAVCEGGCKFMAAWVRKEEKASENLQREREAEEADKAERAPEVTVASSTRFRAALVRPTQGLPKRRRLRRQGNLKILRIWCVGDVIMPLGTKAR